MNLVLRGVIIYFFILIIFRFAGKKTLSEATTFDLVLLLIISEVTQAAMIGNDFSLTASIVLIVTLVSLDFLVNRIKMRSKKISSVVDGLPLIVVEKGNPLKERMKLANVEVDDVLQSARQSFGITSLTEIDYAVLETDGSISIVPSRKAAAVKSSE